MTTKRQKRISAFVAGGSFVIGFTHITEPLRVAGYIHDPKPGLWWMLAALPWFALSLHWLMASK